METRNLCADDGAGPAIYLARRRSRAITSQPSRLTVFVIAAALGLASADARATDKKPISLFDGETFAGWEGDTEMTWRIEEGAIVAGSHDQAAPRNEFLTTTKQFGDFDLRLKYRIVGNEQINAGVQFRTRRIPDHHEVVGYQADIGPNYDGQLYDESRRRRTLAGPDKATLRRALDAISQDDWHTYRIRAVGNRIQLWLNGVPTVEYFEKDDRVARSGVVALQIHGGMRGVVYYKDIRIEPLSATGAEIAPQR